MSLERKLERCGRDQGRVGDLDWRRPPRTLPKSDQIAIVPPVTDMPGTERMDGALVEQQRREGDDLTHEVPLLKEGP